MKILIFITCMVSLFSTQANAHFGHLGELAGHAHWIGLGAVAAAAVIASTLGTKYNDEAEGETDTDINEEPEIAEETA